MAPAQAENLALTLADLPERRELRRLTQQINICRDEIAALDLDIESQRQKLQQFEAHYHLRLAPEHQQLERILRLVRHVERWIDLLHQPPAQARAFQRHARQVDKRRQQELKVLSPGPGTAGAGKRKRSPGPTHPNATVTIPAQPPERGDRLKNAYRALARQYHPDLAATEQQRIASSEIMGRISALYHQGDLERLEMLVEQAREITVDDVAAGGEQLHHLTERLAWFEAVLANLRQERESLDGCSTNALRLAADEASREGRDLLEELREDLTGRIDRAYKDIRIAIRALENEVSRHNRENVAAKVVQPAHDLERVFDPQANKHLVRLGLDQLNLRKISRGGEKMAAWLVEAAPDMPDALNLILLTYVCEMCPYPLEGLETYDDLRLRMGHLCPNGDPACLEKALVEIDHLVEFGVTNATARTAHAGLRFRSPVPQQAVALALESWPIRRAFKEVLAVLGAYTTCNGCRRQIFAVPLYKICGLDDLRAFVCPACGHILRSYWMPVGKDLQAVLNPTFVDYELVCEWSFRLGRESIAMQFLPIQVQTLTLRKLKALFIKEVFTRNQLDVEPQHIELYADGHRPREQTPLSAIAGRRFDIHFTDASPHGPRETIDMLKHRIRSRFRADA